MCGIAGIVTRDGHPPNEDVLRRMSERVKHRGPDGEGMWIGHGIGMAHRRLAVLDLSNHASQPMRSADGRFVIVYNGEVYNFMRLKSELGGAWISASDTEVILKGFERWGTGLFEKLRGMFAIAVWDSKERRLTLARDPVGKKPLFYARARNGDFLFASEVKALRGAAPFEVDWNTVRTFLGLQYVPSPQTGFVGISQISPGSYARWDADGFREARFHRWDSSRAGSVHGMSERAMDDEIRARIDGAVAARLAASDVPVGAFLSGGIDSAAVVAFAAARVDRPLQTFTMGFPDLGMDERAQARTVAKTFGTDHDEFEAKPEHLMELLDTIVAHYDVPYADSSAIPTWLLARETAHEIKVVLTGDGGDEAFGGYRRYGYFLHALRLRSLPVVRLLNGFAGVFHDAKYARMAETIRASRRGWARGYAELFCGSYFGRETEKRLLTNEFRARTTGHGGVHVIERSLKDLQAALRKHPLEHAMFFDLTSYLADDLNVKMDRATMAFGLEARSPFLDVDLLDFCLRLPLNQKVIHGKTKVALRRALQGVLPPSIVHRRKMGFQVPLASWFRGPLRDAARERCLSHASPLSPLFVRKEMQRLFDENDRGTDHGNRLWMLVSLATWLAQNSKFQS